MPEDQARTPALRAKLNGVSLGLNVHVGRRALGSAGLAVKRPLCNFIVEVGGFMSAESSRLYSAIPALRPFVPTQPREKVLYEFRAMAPMRHRSDGLAQSVGFLPLALVYTSVKKTCCIIAHHSPGFRVASAS
jgi:hypothetical protein